MFLHTNSKAFSRQLSDEILVARVARGDATALETLYDRHAAIVLGVCLRIISDCTLAECTEVGEYGFGEQRKQLWLIGFDQVKLE